MVNYMFRIKLPKYSTLITMTN